MSNLIRCLLICGVFSLAFKAQAFFTEIGGFYFSDNLNPSSDITNTRMFFDGTVGMPLDKKGKIVIGWCVSKLSYTQSGSSDLEVSTLEHGPRLGWYIDKNQNWSIFATYNLFANATFTGSETLTWRGNSFKVDFGYTPMISESMYLGARLNYYSASYGEQFDASDDFSEISTAQSMIFPTVTFGWRF